MHYNSFIVILLVPCQDHDRIVISNTFAIDLGILDKTLEFAPGE